jgi:hypothetical protein
MPSGLTRLGSRFYGQRESSKRIGVMEYWSIGLPLLQRPSLPSPVVVIHYAPRQFSSPVPGPPPRSCFSAPVSKTSIGPNKTDGRGGAP